MDVLPFELKAQHVTTGHPPGAYIALLMPRYVTSLAQHFPIRDETAMAKSLTRMICALEHVHGLGWVHMDVKVCAGDAYVDVQIVMPPSVRRSLYEVVTRPMLVCVGAAHS